MNVNITGISVQIQITQALTLTLTKISARPLKSVRIYLAADVATNTRSVHSGQPPP